MHEYYMTLLAHVYEPNGIVYIYTTHSFFIGADYSERSQ